MVERVFGVDLHTNKFNYHLINRSGKKERRGSFYIRQDGKGVNDFLNLLNENDMVVFEATGNSSWFARLVSQKTKNIKIVNPHKFPLIGHSKKKTDRIDAEKLAGAGLYSVLSNETLFGTVRLQEPHIDELRSLFTMLAQLNKKINMTRNNIHALLKKIGRPHNGVNLMKAKERIKILSIDMPESYKLQITLSYSELDILYAHKQELEEAVKSYAKYYYEEVKIMISVTGVSILVAMSMKADYGDISNFANGRYFTSYLGTAPTISSSNNKTKIGHINKASRRNSLHYVLQMLMFYYRSNDDIIQVRARLLIGKSKGKTRIAIARRFYRMIFAMLRDKTLYKYVKPELYNNKLKELDKIAGEKPVAA